MGGWISLKMANLYPDIIKGLVLIAPAVNFLRKKYKLWYDNASPEIQKDQDEGKAIVMDSTYGSVPVRKDFVMKSAELEFDLTQKLDIQCPVKIIHGVQDDTVPFKQSIDVLQMISTDQVELIYQKSGDHRMQNIDGIELIKKTLDEIVCKI